MLNAAHLQRDRTFVVLDVLQLEHQELKLAIHRTSLAVIDPIKSLLRLVAIFLRIEQVEDLLDRGRVFFAELEADVVQDEDENFDVALAERSEQVLDDIEEEFATNRLEQEQVQQAVHDVLDPHHCSLLLLSIALTRSHRLMVVFKGTPDALKHFCEESCSAQAM